MHARSRLHARAVPVFVSAMRHAMLSTLLPLLLQPCKGLPHRTHRDVSPLRVLAAAHADQQVSSRGWVAGIWLAFALATSS